MDRKKKFIDAYLVVMGGNKETAEKVYKEQNDSYINAVIEWFDRTVKLISIMIKEKETKQ